MRRYVAGHRAFEHVEINNALITCGVRRPGPGGFEQDVVAPTRTSAASVGDE